MLCYWASYAFFSLIGLKFLPPFRAFEAWCAYMLEYFFQLCRVNSVEGLQGLKDLGIFGACVGLDGLIGLAG